MPTESLTNDSRFVNETMLVNVTGSIRRETYNGRRYLVAPMVTIVPGVLNGSRGALYYPPEEVSKEPGVWNHVPLVLNHPMEGGQYVSARSPGVLEKYQLGYVFNDRWDGSRRTAEGWFDEEHTRRISPDVYDALSNNRPIELSTGLMTDNHIAANGSNYNGKPYTHVARNYRPDHLAILPKQRGACSNKDGCGVLVNANPEGVNQYSSGSAQGSADVSGSPAMTDAQKKYPEMAHMLNGAKLHSEGLSKKAAREEAKSLRRDGKYSNVWKDPKTGKHFVTVVNSACECGGECEKCKLRDETKNLLGQDPVGNALGRGNHSLAKRASHAEELSKLADSASEMATDAESHKAAKEAHEAAAAAHRSAAYEAAHGMSTWAEPDFGASGMHANKAKNHEDKALKHSRDITGNCGGPGSGVPGPCPGSGKGSGDSHAGHLAVTGSGAIKTDKGSIEVKYDSKSDSITIVTDHPTYGRVEQTSFKLDRSAEDSKDAPSVSYDKKSGRVKITTSKTHQLDFKADWGDKTRNQQGDDMPINRAEVIANLTTNCDCWRGKEKTLNSLDDSTLETVANQQAQLAQRELVVNAAKEIVGDVALNAMPAALQAAMDKKAGKTPAKAPVTDPEEEEDDVEDEEAMVKNFLKLPADKRMLPGELEALNFAKGMVSNAKTRLVEKIVTANSATETGRKAIRPTFEAMDLKTLQTLAAEVDSRPTANEHQAEVVNNHLIDYLGLGGAYSPSRGQVNNVDEDDVLSPYAYQHAKPKK